MNLLKDRGLLNLPELVELIKKENKDQIDKWGIQETIPSEWMLFTMEELGELAEAISEYEYRNGSVKNIVNEAIQTHPGL